MTDLSPAAQAVLDASNLLPGKDSYLILAAALRAAADQVVPVSEPPQRSDFSDLSVYQWAVDVYAYDDATRRKLLAIADELQDA